MDGKSPKRKEITRKKRTRKEIIGLQYLSTMDIARLLQIGYPRAKKIYNVAFEKDKEELKKYILFENKVRLKTVLDVTGMNYNLLLKQINESEKLNG